MVNSRLLVEFFFGYGSKKINKNISKLYSILESIKCFGKEEYEASIMIGNWECWMGGKG